MRGSPDSHSHASRLAARGTAALLLLVGIGLIGLGGFAACDATTAAWQSPNIVLISLDTLRADRLSIYGHEQPTTPNLERLAREAAVFDRAYTHAPHTLAAHTSLLTGLTPGRHGVLYRGSSLSDQEVTLAETLAANGYRNVAVVNVLYLAPEVRLDRGFEVYDYASDLDGARNAEQTNARVLDDLVAATKRPFFLFAHYFDAHSDSRQAYEAPSNYIARFAGTPPPDYRLNQRVFASRQMLALNRQGLALRPSELDHLARLYDAGVAYLDAQIGALLDALEQRGLLENTIVIVTSDHGEEFQDHGELLHGQVFEELVRVPLLISLPEMRGAPARSCRSSSSLGIARPGRIDGVVQHVDLFATLADCLGLELPERVQGRSFLSQISGGPSTREWAYFEAAQGRQMGILRDRFKLVESLDQPARLFDLEDDPREQRDVSSEYPDIANELAQELARYQHENSLTRSRMGEFEVPLEVERALEALGYSDRASPK